ncbi:MAG: L-rhamnose mutarotase [Flavobacteriaceae bacterium]|jgi:L-rhamnose mutarotase|nr:L-rhamnose mutarotase [Flavobacteriaceae bacterium]MDG2314202.1 L-rhamnose mutarotase [Flavobacteriaceae bacterium]
MAKNFKKYGLALDLKNDPEKIATYIKYHQEVWPEINHSIKASGIQNAEIYHIENRLFMIIEVDEFFSFEKKAKLDASNPKVQEWETLMWEFQKALPNAKSGQKWVLMDKIYDLNKNV